MQDTDVCMQYNYIYMQNNYVYMQDNYVHMRDIYVYMQDIYVYMQANYVYIITENFSHKLIFSHAIELQGHRKNLRGFMKVIITWISINFSLKWVWP